MIDTVDQTQPTVFLRYINDCRLLLRQIAHRIDDIAFVLQGGTIRYAVDFSEIYAYAVPGQTGAKFQLVVDENARVADAIQRQVLSRLFEAQSDPLILLNPYAIELHSFLIREQQHYIHRFADIFQTDLSWETALAQPEYQRINDIGAELEITPRDLSPDEVDLIAGFLEQHAPGLVEALDQSDPKPVATVKRLFSDNRLVSLDSLTSVDLRFDNPETIRWYQRLLDLRLTKIKTEDQLEKHARIRATTQMDALALALVDHANQLLQQHNTRLLLVTRSFHMHQLFAPAAPEDLTIYPSFLRHPRIFSDLFSVNGYPPARLISQLQDRADAIRLFLEAVNQEPVGHPSADLDTKVNDLKQHWSGAELLAMSFRLTSTTEPDTQRLNSDQARMLLPLLRDQQALKTRLATRLQELVTSLDHAHELLGLYLHSISDDEQKRIVAILRTQEDDYTRRSSRLITMQSMPYTLRFYTPAARQLLLIIREAQHGARSWSDVLDYLKTGFAPGSNFERLLAMAAIFAAIGKWPLAEIYAERACQIAKDEGAIPNEGYYFLAICKRKSAPSAKRHLEAIALLDAALEAQRDASGAWNRRALRYLKEKSTHILFLHTEEYPQSSEYPSIADGLALLEQAEAASADDLLFKAQCLNNRLYYYVTTNQLDDRTQRIADLERLEHILARFDQNARNWPAFILDTLALAHWKLEHPQTAAQREKTLQLLEYALNIPFLEPADLRRLQNHQRQIHDAPVVMSA